MTDDRKIKWEGEIKWDLIAPTVATPEAIEDAVVRGVVPVRWISLEEARAMYGQRDGD